MSTEDQQKELRFWRAYYTPAMYVLNIVDFTDKEIAELLENKKPAFLKFMYAVRIRLSHINVTEDFKGFM